MDCCVCSDLEGSAVVVNVVLEENASRFLPKFEKIDATGQFLPSGKLFINHWLKVRNRHFHRRWIIRNSIFLNRDRCIVSSP